MTIVNFDIHSGIDVLNTPINFDLLSSIKVGNQGVINFDLVSSIPVAGLPVNFDLQSGIRTRIVGVHTLTKATIDGVPHVIEMVL